MQIVIEITKELYERIKWLCSYGMGDNLQKKVIKGTPIPDNATVCDIEQIRYSEYESYERGIMSGTQETLERIRAEIASYKDDKVIHAERNEMIDIVLDIIDKYTKGEQHDR